MKKKHCLSPEDFDKIGFSEAFLLSHEVRDGILVLVIWGCAIIRSIYPELGCLVASNDSDDPDVYINGSCEFSLPSIISYTIRISPYAEKPNSDPFTKDEHGNEVEVLEAKTVHDLPDGVLHYFDCVNTIIFGYCRVEIMQAGSIDFVFDEDDLVSLDHFVRNARNYGLPSLPEAR